MRPGDFSRAVVMVAMIDMIVVVETIKVVEGEDIKEVEVVGVGQGKAGKGSARSGNRQVQMLLQWVRRSVRDGYCHGHLMGFCASRLDESVRM